jgi:hypothetical protein
MNRKIHLQLVVIIIVLVSIAATSIPDTQARHDIAWDIGYDSVFEKNVLTLRHDAASGKVYQVGVAKAGDDPAYDEGAFDEDLSFELCANFWLFAETTAGVTVFHVWREDRVVKITVDGMQQKDFVIPEPEDTPEKSDGMVAFGAELDYDVVSGNQ